MVVQRVQALAEAGLSYLPSEYIQPPELRPDRHCHIPAAAASAESDSIPVLDLDPSMSPLYHIRLLCSEWGAFQVVNHGVPSRLLEEMKEAGLRFFRSPTEAKLRYACDPGSAATEGYGSRMLSKEEGVLDWRDYFDHHTLPDSRRNPSRWPDFPDNYRDVVVEYSDSMKVLAQKLLSMISESLNLPLSYIEDAIGEVHQNITISYYSPCPQPELALGLQSHSDMGAITLLIQDDVGGLEVFKDGKWVLAKPLSDAIVVILADQTEILTNGIYKSAVHRAIVNGHRARISVAAFYDPAKTRKVSPALQLVTERSPLKYCEVLYGDYVSSWYSRGPEAGYPVSPLHSGATAPAMENAPATATVTSPATDNGDLYSQSLLSSLSTRSNGSVGTVDAAGSASGEGKGAGKEGGRE